MFEVGFSELLMVGLVALLVLGPDKLPKAARIAGFWLGKTRSAIEKVKAEISQEFQAEELRQLLDKQTIGKDIQQTLVDTETVLNEINASIKTPLEHSITEQNQLQDDKSV